MAPGPLSGLFRKGIGYGAYTFGDGAVTARSANPLPPGQNKQFFGLTSEQLKYLVIALIAFKLLF